MRIRWRQVVPFLFTMAAMLAGFYSLVCAADGRYMLSAQMIMLSMILDGMDGNIARMLRGTSRLGAELDTFVDMISFGVAPAFLAYKAALEGFGAWGFLVASLVVLAGAYRLARFRVVDPHRGQRGYVGLPITVNAGWLAMFIFIADSDLLDHLGLSLVEGPLATVVWTCAVGFAVLEVSRLRYGKPTKTPMVFMTCAVFVALLFLKIQLAVASALAICMGLFFYAAVSPFLPKQEEGIGFELDAAGEKEPVTVHHS